MADSEERDEHIPATSGGNGSSSSSSSRNNNQPDRNAHETEPTQPYSMTEPDLEATAATAPASASISSSPDTQTPRVQSRQAGLPPQVPHFPMSAHDADQQYPMVPGSAQSHSSQQSRISGMGGMCQSSSMASLHFYYDYSLPLRQVQLIVPISKRTVS